MVASEHASATPGKYQVGFFISFLAKELVLAKSSKRAILGFLYFFLRI
jgi:hypothetical protein